MEQTLFWNLTKPESTARRAEWIDDEIETEKVICPLNDGHQRGGKRLTNLSIALLGSGVQDFVWTWYSDCLVQDHVLEFFQKNEFTGFDVKPVKARFKQTSASKPPTLWELTVTGWGGMASEKSGVKLIKRCESCGHIVYSGCDNLGDVIDVSQWDGSDFFIVWPLPNFIFVHNRVADVIRENRLTGAVLTRPQDRYLNADGFSPGRLSYCMPEDRAHELGDSLGIA